MGGELGREQPHAIFDPLQGARQYHCLEIAVAHAVDGDCGDNYQADHGKGQATR
jgi:hypothetical protein